MKSSIIYLDLKPAENFKDSGYKVRVNYLLLNNVLPCALSYWPCALFSKEQLRKVILVHKQTVKRKGPIIISIIIRRFIMLA